MSIFIPNSVMTVITIVDIHTSLFNIEADTILLVQKLKNGTQVAHYQGANFEIEPEEFIALNCLPKSTSH
jgi:hypothetical protein